MRIESSSPSFTGKLSSFGKAVFPFTKISMYLKSLPWLSNKLSERPGILDRKSVV
jgi:hypothetical protein